MCILSASLTPGKLLPQHLEYPDIRLCRHIHFRSRRWVNSFISRPTFRLLVWLWTKIGLESLSALSLPIALQLGATLSATDPVTVIAIFTTYKVDPKLFTIIFGEVYSMTPLPSSCLMRSDGLQRVMRKSVWSVSLRLSASSSSYVSQHPFDFRYLVFPHHWRVDGSWYGAHVKTFSTWTILTNRNMFDRADRVRELFLQ